MPAKPGKNWLSASAESGGTPLPPSAPFLPLTSARPLLAAVRARGLSQLEEALAGGADVNEPFDEGMTALMLAAKVGWADGVALLLSRGADVHQRNRLGYRALTLAHWYGERTTGAARAAYNRTFEVLRAAGSRD